MSRPLSPWAGWFREALFSSDEARGLWSNGLLFPVWSWSSNSWLCWQRHPSIGGVGMCFGEVAALLGMCAIPNFRSSSGSHPTGARGGGGIARGPPYSWIFCGCSRHLGWLASELVCSRSVLVKRLTLFLDGTFDTVKDFKLLGAVPILAEALSGLKKEDWRDLLHATTSPLPRVGEMRPELLRIGLGPVGSHMMP